MTLNPCLSSTLYEDTLNRGLIKADVMHAPLEMDSLAFRVLQIGSLNIYVTKAWKEGILDAPPTIYTLFMINFLSWIFLMNP